MADYRVLVGTELDTSGINTALKNYKGKVNVGVTLDTSGIASAISKYKSKPISVSTKLNTDGITEAIRSYNPPKKIHLESELSTVGIDNKIKNYTPTKPIKVDVELTKSSINQQIRDYKPSEHITINAKLDNGAITKAIRDYKAAAPIKVMVDPDFSEAGAKISNYQMRNMLKVNVKLNKTFIDKQIQNFQTSSKIEVGAKLRDNAIEAAIRKYTSKELVPVTIDFKVGDTKEVTNKINEYKNTPVIISAKLQPAKTGFDSAVTKKTVKVGATLDPENIDKTIEGFRPTSKIRVDVKLESKDINAQLKKLPKPTDPIDVDVKLNDASVNSAIAKVVPTSRIKAGVSLKTEDINKQIESIHPTSRVNVRVNLDNNDIDEKTGKQNIQEPVLVNVSLNTEKINEQIKSFKTQSKIKVGVKLDFASHKGGQKGIPQQINEYKTNAKIKVGVQLDKDDIAQQIGQVKVDSPIKLGVELDPEGIQRVQKQVDNFREQIKALGNVKINLGGGRAGYGAGGTGGKSIGVGSGIQQGFVEADIKITDMENHIKSLQSALKTLGFNKSSIDSITRDFEELDVVVKNVTTRLDKNNNLSLTIKGLDDAGRAVTMINSIDAKGNLTSLGTSVSQSFKETEASFARLKTVANQMKGLKVQIAGLDSEKNKNKIAELTSQLTKLQTEYRDLYAITQRNLNTSQLDELKRKSIETSNAVRIAKSAMSDKAAYDKEQREIRETRDEYQKLIKIANSMQRIKVTLTGLDAEKDKQRIAELTSQLKTLQASYRDLFVSKQNGFDTRQLEALKQKSIETANAVRDAKAAMADDVANFANGIRGSFSGYDAEVKSLETSIRRLVSPTDEVKNSLGNVKQALIDMKNASNDNELIEAEERYQKELKETQAQLLINQSIEKQDGGIGAENFAIKKEAALIRISNLFEDGSMAAKRFGAEARNLTEELNKVGSVSGVDKVNAKIANLEKKIKKSNLQTKTFSTRLKDQFSKYSQYLSIASIFMYAAQAARSMFEQVKLIDSAMTELKKVTNETDAAYNQFLNNAATRAKEIGTTIDGLVSSTADFARLGYGFKDAQGLAEVANIYAVVGDEIEGVEGATESLISTMAAFKDEMNGMSNSDFAMSIVDKFNIIGNNFAISSGGIGEAMERSASSMKAANNTIDETIALITAANTVVQNPDAVGTAFKTISMRIRGAKTELEEAGLETEGMVQSTAKLRQEIIALSGVDIMESDGQTFKSTYAILDELAKKWKDLSDIQQATITELIAGKRQGNIVSSLMNNFDTARDALETSLNSSGSAMEEHAKWQKSLEAQINNLKAAWQGLSQAFLNSDFLKIGIKSLTGLLKVIEKLIKLFGTLGTIGLGAGLYGLFKGGFFKNLLNVLPTVVSMFGDIISSSDKFGKKIKDVGATVKMAGEDSTKGMNSLSKAGTIIGLAIAAIGLIYNHFKKIREEQSRARQEAIETSDAFLDAATSFEQAYIKYSGRTDLTAEEEQELEVAINGTVDALNDKSSALQNVVNSSNDYVKSLEQITQKELEEANRAAKVKKDNAAIELKNSMKDFLGSNAGATAHISNDEKILGLAREVDSDFLNKKRKKYGKSKVSTVSYSFALSDYADADEMLQYYNDLIEFQELLSENNLGETETYANVSSVINQMKDSVETYADALYEAEKAQYVFKNGIPKTTDDYLKMRESVVGSFGGSFETKLNIANSLDAQYGEILDLTSAEIQARKFIGVIRKYGDGTKDGTNDVGTVETFLNMRTAVNNNECTVGQYMSQLDKINAMTEEYTEEERKEFNSSFGIDTDTIKQQHDEVYKYLSEKDISALDDYENTPEFRLEKDNIREQEIKDFLNGLSAYELEAVINLKTDLDWENDSWDDILNQIEEEAKLIEAISFSVNLEIETAHLENLSTAITESVSGAGLGDTSISAVEDMFGDLDSYDQSKLFERTANGIRLNSDELRKLNDEYKQTNVDGLNKKVDALGERYVQTREELSDLTYGTEEYNKKARELSSIEAQINATEKLAAQYEGLASAYQTWQRAESAGSQRDMYESMIEGLENVDDEISRGWLDDGTIEFLRLIKGDTLSATATTKELKEAYKSLDDTIKHTTYSVRDFFTVDEDGNSTNTGVYNFLDAIGQMEEEKFGGKDVVKRDKNGNVIAFDFQVAGGDKAIADALGISEELVDIMVRAADDAGFVVSMDGTYQQLDVLKDKAQEAADKLKNTFKKTKFEFDLNTGDDGSVLEQYNESLKIWEEFKKNKAKDGTVDMSVEGAEEAFTLVSTLQSMVDKLSEPVYMELNASQVEKDMQAPLNKLQEYETLTQTEHQLQLKGTDTSAIEADKKEIIDYFDELQENSPEIAAELGVEGLTREEIEKKLEAGEIKIPATIDLQVEMNNTMRDMVNVALYNAGIIDEEELKTRVDVELYANEVDASKVVNDIDSVLEESNLSEEKQVTIKAFAEVFGVENVEDLDKKLDSLSDEKIQVLAEVLGRIDVEKLKTTVEGLDDKTVEAIAKALGEGDVDGLKTTINELDDKTVQAIAQAFGYGDVSELNGAIEDLDPKTVQAIAQALGITDVDSLKASIDRLTDKNVDAVANVDGKNDVDNLQSSIDNLKGKTVTIWAQVKKIASDLWSKITGSDEGGSGANGTANVNGTTGRAFKQGSWGTKNSGTALVGELGREVLVRDGRYYTIGDNGAEFIKYKKGDIIFNHIQSEELFKNGKVTSGNGRAKAFVGGAAFVGGTAFKNGSTGTGGVGAVSVDANNVVVNSKTSTTNANTNSTKSDNGSTGTGGVGKVNGKSVGSESSKSSSSKEFEETIDFVEIALSRIQREIDNLDKKAGNVYKSWSERNTALSKEINKVGDEIALQQSAAQEYLKEANQVGLSESYAKKIREGSLSIEDFKGESNEELVEKIKDYQKWYELYLKCTDAAEELREQESKLYAQRFENVQAQYDGILQGYEHTEAMLNEYISQAEEKGHIVSKKYYQALISNEKQNINDLKKEQADLIAERDNAVADGKITKYSEEWYNMCAEIDGVTKAIEEGTTAIIEYDKAMREIDWEKFDLTQEKISDVTAESDFLIDLMSNKELHDDNGKLTEHGAATLGLHGLNYNTHMYQADDYGAEIANIDRQIASGELDKNSKDVINRRRELVEAQRESILAAEDEKQAIKDLVEDGINKELDALQERIDLHNEELDSMKELYDYQKDVEEQTENIASLRKQLNAYEGFDNEESRAKVQELKVSLEEAEADLRETEYDKFISDQTALLDTLYTEYENILNSRLDNIDYLLQGVIDGINAAASEEGTIATALGSEGAIAMAIVNAMGENGTIKTILNTEASAVGTTLSTAMNNIWSVGEGNAKSVLTQYGDGFQGQQTTTNATLSSIKTDIAAMVDDVDKDAQKKIEAPKTQSSAKANPTNNTASTAKPATNTNKSAGDGKPKVGDKVKFISGSYYYDSYGTKPIGSKYQGKEVYITHINTKGSHPYHISTGKTLGSGDLGWLKLNQLSGYATGKRKISNSKYAWTQENGKEFIVRPSDGAILTPVAKGDSVLSATASGNIWSMANNPAEFIKNNIKMDAANIPNGANVQSNYTQHLDKVVFNLPNVKNYDELLAAMQRDKNFERLILSMSIDRIAGKSSLAKGKSIR